MARVSAAWVGSTVLFQPAIVPSSVANNSVLGAELPFAVMMKPAVPLVATPVGAEAPVPPGAGTVTAACTDWAAARKVARSS